MKNKALEAKLIRLGVLDKFLANAVFDSDNLKMLTAFTWDYTPEGSKFWDDIATKCGELDEK